MFFLQSFVSSICFLLDLEISLRCDHHPYTVCLSSLVLLGIASNPHTFCFLICFVVVSIWSLLVTENRHVYCLTCLFSILFIVDISSLNFDILFWMLLASLFTLLSVTMFSLGAKCTCFLV